MNATPHILGLARVHFATLRDPRVVKSCDHALLDVLVIALAAVLCGAEGWDEIEDFAEVRRAWLASFLDLPNGTPSADTFRRVFEALHAARLAACLGAWMQSLDEVTEGRLLIVDGKALRGALDRRRGGSPLHLVSVWAAQNQLVLAQRATDAGSNEVTAIPALLRTLDLARAVVSIDAAGCHRATAQAIVDGGGDYLLHLKANQRTLYERLEAFFRDARTTAFDGIAHHATETVDDAHGRHEVRRVWAVSERSWLGAADDWPKLRSAICVERERTLEGRTSVETHYYLSSLVARSAPRFAAAIRAHWTIENQLHWCLDVQMREDACRVRDRNAATNLGALRRVALSLLKRADASKTMGLRRKMRRAAMDPSYLSSVFMRGIAS